MALTGLIGPAQPPQGLTHPAMSSPRAITPAPAIWQQGQSPAPLSPAGPLTDVAAWPQPIPVTIKFPVSGAGAVPGCPAPGWGDGTQVQHCWCPHRESAWLSPVRKLPATLGPDTVARGVPLLCAELGL